MSNENLLKSRFRNAPSAPSSSSSRPNNVIEKKEGNEKKKATSHIGNVVMKSVISQEQQERDAQRERQLERRREQRRKIAEEGPTMRTMFKTVASTNARTRQFETPFHDPVNFAQPRSQIRRRRNQGVRPEAEEERYLVGTTTSYVPSTSYNAEEGDTNVSYDGDCTIVFACPTVAASCISCTKPSGTVAQLRKTALPDVDVNVGGGIVIPWDESDFLDAPWSWAGAGSSSLVWTGGNNVRVRLSLNLGVNSSVQRFNAFMRIRQNTVPIGESTCGYIRSTSGNNNGSFHISNVWTIAMSGDVFDVHSTQEAAAGTANVFLTLFSNNFTAEAYP